MNALDTDNGRVYITLVLATAWQESCWRQFVMVGDRVRWLESGTGDIGLMQVNKHVWRGFYDIDRLKWDVLYNAGAGCEILATHDAVRGHLAAEIRSRADLEPSRAIDIRRLQRRPRRMQSMAPPRARQRSSKSITSFLEKYHAIESGTQIDILSCSRCWNH